MRILIPIRWALLAMALVASTGMRSQADDAPSKDAKASAAKDKQGDTAGKKKEDKGEVPPLLQRLTKELFKEIDEESVSNAVNEHENKLDRAAKGMRTAGEKLDDKRTGDETRKIQEQVIRDLDDLINQLQNPPPPQGGGGGGGGTMSKSQLQKLKGQQGQAGRSQQANAQSAQGDAMKEGGTSKKSGGRDKETAGGSEERSGAEKKAAEEAAKKKRLEMDVWGHLPPHLRDQLLNTYGERMLPKYQHLVKQFYEALSEQGGPRR